MRIVRITPHPPTHQPPTHHPPTHHPPTHHPPTRRPPTRTNPHRINSQIQTHLPLPTQEPLSFLCLGCSKLASTSNHHSILLSFVQESLCYVQSLFCSFIVYLGKSMPCPMECICSFR